MITLVVRRKISAAPERLFDAWTRPEELQKWWGPRGVICVAAQVDLRVGGLYRIANQFPDGKVIWITGEFEIIERPSRLAYTWKLESQAGPVERVMVTFKGSGTNTEVVVRHERIAEVLVRERHEQGWRACLSGLAAYAETGL